ncbi:MAG: SDR family NAD(P)-dependent oxidoreductase [Acidobacteria bacterium]|nr:SDR family NAD(P)-dependent oxidoreductase [Acidobacteriota bacterium]
MNLITTPFGRNSTAMEVIEGIDLTGKRAIVTGGASGIGIETTRALAKAGADVTVAVRNTNAAEDIVRDISSSTGNVRLKISELDLTDLASVRSFCETWYGPLDILINNAGIMAYPELKLASGHELQFATNHLGHFALSVWLLDALKQAGNARIVSVSSSAHQRSPVIFDDVNFLFRAYDPFLAYGQSKTANILFSVAASELWKADGITSNALMPGSIPSKLEQYIGGPLPPTEKSKTPEQGAATSILLATSPLLEGIGGRYFVDCNETYVAESRTTDMTGVAPFAIDRDNAMRLWEYSLNAIK